jgi:perosamine synthetase
MDIDAVSDALYEGNLATGVVVEEYEEAFAGRHGYRYGVAVNSGTAALWCAYNAIGHLNQREVITSPLTFAATANMIVASGAMPVFADVERSTLCIGVDTIAKVTTNYTKLVVPVELCGRSFSELELCKYGRVPVVVDAAHSAGVVSRFGDIRCYSTHAAKNMTTCEGGIAITDDKELADRMKVLRNHGITSTPRERESHGYEMTRIGFNFRMPDPLAALGLSQLRWLTEFNAVRAKICEQYNRELCGRPGLITLVPSQSSNHLYIVLLDIDILRCDRDCVFYLMRKAGIGVNVHYRPVYRFEAYQDLGYGGGLCPNAEWAYDRMLSLPVYPGMEQWKVEYVVSTLLSIVKDNLK